MLSRENGHHRGKTESSPNPKSVDSPICNIQDSKTVRNIWLLFKPPSLQHTVTTVQAETRHGLCGSDECKIGVHGQNRESTQNIVQPKTSSIESAPRQGSLVWYRQQTRETVPRGHEGMFFVRGCTGGVGDKGMCLLECYRLPLVLADPYITAGRGGSCLLLVLPYQPPFSASF